MALSNYNLGCVSNISFNKIGHKYSISYNNTGPSPSFITELQHESQKALLYAKEYFPGACYSCGAMSSVIGVPVSWCTGCKLVAYCNKNCQRADWKAHKIVCKTFPVEMGKNIIARKTESVRNDVYSFGLAMDEIHRSDLCNKHARFLKESTYGVQNIFANPNVCNICRDARTEKLSPCRCCFVSYCRQHHLIKSTNHFPGECYVLYGRAMANWYLTQHHKLLIPDGLLNEVNLYDGINFEKVSKLSKYSSEKWLEAIVHLINNSLTYPLSILHALKNLKLGGQRKVISEITSLTIHIVHNLPMLDPSIWEFMLHQLPNLKILNLIFVNKMLLNNPYNTNLSVERCSDCKSNQRVINYEIHNMYYHEYFSSDDYVQPDIVAAFGTFIQLSFGTFIKMASGQVHTGENIEKAERFTNQGNMTYCKDTVVIITAQDEDKLEDSVKSFHDARPVKVLLPVQENPAARFCIEGYSKNNIVNPCRYLCCLQGNH